MLKPAIRILVRIHGLDQLRRLDPPDAGLTIGHVLLAIGLDGAGVVRSNVGLTEMGKMAELLTEIADGEAAQWWKLCLLRGGTLYNPCTPFSRLPRQQRQRPRATLGIHARGLAKSQFGRCDPVAHILCICMVDDNPRSHAALRLPRVRPPSVAGLHLRST